MATPDRFDLTPTTHVLLIPITRSQLLYIIGVVLQPLDVTFRVFSFPLARVQPNGRRRRQPLLHRPRIIEPEF